MKICSVILHGQPPADSKAPDFQDLHSQRQHQLQFSLLSPAANTCYITIDITDGNTKLKFDQVRVSVRSELSAKQHRLTHGWEVVYKIFLFFPIVCRTSSGHAIASSLKRYGRSSVISLFTFLRRFG